MGTLTASKGVKEGEVSKGHDRRAEGRVGDLERQSLGAGLGGRWS